MNYMPFAITLVNQVPDIILHSVKHKIKNGINLMMFMLPENTMILLLNMHIFYSTEEKELLKITIWKRP